MLQALPKGLKLIIAADFETWQEAATFAHRLKSNGVGTHDGISFKLESLAKGDYNLIRKFALTGFKVMADLKLVGTHITLQADARRLCEFSPASVTVYCASGVESLTALKAELPDTQVLGVTVPTTFDDTQSICVFGCPVLEAVMRFAEMADRAKLDGIVCAPSEAARVRRTFPNLIIATPNIRPFGIEVKGENQNPFRSSTPQSAVRSGSQWLIVGKPVTQSNDPISMVERVVTEMIAGCYETDGGVR